MLHRSRQASPEGFKDADELIILLHGPCPVPKLVCQWKWTSQEAVSPSLDGYFLSDVCAGASLLAAAQLVSMPWPIMFFSAKVERETLALPPGIPARCGLTS